MGEGREAYGVLVRQPEGERLEDIRSEDTPALKTCMGPARRRHRWEEDNIKMDLDRMGGRRLDLSG
jgi:hypothetical protein